MIKEWLDSYKPANEQEAKDALREIMQEIALAGLYRAGFFEKAAFYGGTALRIFYGLDRFSEDLDFSLLDVDTEFNLGKYQEAIVNEFESLGMKVSIREKKKTVKSNIMGSSQKCRGFSLAHKNIENCRRFFLNDMKPCCFGDPIVQ
ncbi:hypothetical protein GCM10007415_34460 [Parapedobacter pyrenivorans]|uniref:Nucleotidyl transferase AbiEii toxin, Type IV TA system n=1 Tax=Parapedobacter pyrenivorans TaxID=1305674 RepID=A0A917HYQ4_9SPHI|nr:nucleotidyl transferase AbiEii/AbiGii toxin family protein [Parapedobacter pyrenivorans]GGG96373.1 hypothetical protein GCM10007415_34460 [Parapedobacter pyrenivorans]